MNYIPTYLASLHLDELRRQAAVERRSRHAVRVRQPDHPDRARRQPLKPRLSSLGRPLSQG